MGIKYPIMKPIIAPVKDRTILTSIAKIPKRDATIKKNIENPTKIFGFFVRAMTYFLVRKNMTGITE